MGPPTGPPSGAPQSFTFSATPVFLLLKISVGSGNWASCSGALRSSCCLGVSKEAIWHFFLFRKALNLGFLASLRAPHSRAQKVS